MRKFLSISLVVLLVFQCMGFLWLQHLRLGLWHATQWEHLEAQLEAGEDFEHALTLRINRYSDVEWENAHEFRYAGDMYDVLSMRASRYGGWELRGVADKKEGKMRSDFEAMLQAQDTGQGGSDGGRIVTVRLVNYVEVLPMPMADGLAMVSGFWEYDWAMEMAPAFPPEGHPPAVC